MFEEKNEMDDKVKELLLRVVKGINAKNEREKLMDVEIIFQHKSKRHYEKKGYHK
jgi:hypothetical protein